MKHAVKISSKDGIVKEFRSLRNALRNLLKEDGSGPIVPFKKGWSCSRKMGLSLLVKNGYAIVDQSSVIIPEVVIPEKPNTSTETFPLEHEKFGTLLKVISARCNAMLIGPAGSGKTAACENVAKHLGLPFYAISVGAQTTKFEFFGYKDAHGNYNGTMFRKAFEFGGIFLIDEMDAGNANVLTSLNAALSSNICAFGDDMVTKHKDFVCVASANTWGNGASKEYVGRNVLDGASKTRFVPIQWNYDLKLEDRLCPNKKWLMEVRRVRALVEQNSMRYIISPRASINGTKLLEAGLDWNEVRDMLLIQDMNESERKIVNA
jgi:cobaltochelatase CobS